MIRIQITKERKEKNNKTIRNYVGAKPLLSVMIDSMLGPNPSTPCVRTGKSDIKYHMTAHKL